jgi:TRAP transporter TAXI family solute receptor
MRYLVKPAAAVALVLIAVFVLTRSVLAPLPPRSVRIAAGAPDGAYAATAARYREIFRRHGVALVVVHTSGSGENARLLAAAPPAGVDLAFMQGGSGPAVEAAGAQVEALVSVFFEPLWVFVRSALPVRRLPDLAGRRVATGAEGSGTRALTLELLRANGLPTTGPALVGAGGREAMEALLEGRVDAAFFVTARPLPPLEPLFRSSAVRLLPIERADAYVRRYRYLSRLVVPEGMLDLATNLPRRDTVVLAAAAAVVARRDLHPVVRDLAVLAALEVHAGGDAFAEAGTFPSQQFLDLEPDRAAARFLRSGPSFLQRRLPLWIAAWIERLVLLLLPLLALLIPVVRFAPTIYRWQVERRLLRRYGQLRAIEARARAATTADERRALGAELDALEADVAALAIPVGFSEALYNLRTHVELARRTLST